MARAGARRPRRHVRACRRRIPARRAAADRVGGPHRRRALARPPSGDPPRGRAAGRPGAAPGAAGRAADARALPERSPAGRTRDLSSPPPASSSCSVSSRTGGSARSSSRCLSRIRRSLRPLSPTGPPPPHRASVFRSPPSRCRRRLHTRRRGAPTWRRTAASWPAGESPRGSCSSATEPRSSAPGAPACSRCSGARRSGRTTRCARCAASTRSTTPP